MCATITAFAETQKTHEGVKTEFATPQFAIPSPLFSNDYIAEETFEVIPFWAPQAIGAVTEGHANDVFHPPSSL